MKSPKETNHLKWIRHPSYQSDLVHGCPPKVDSPSVNAPTVDTPLGCPPKVD